MVALPGGSWRSAPPPGPRAEIGLLDPHRRITPQSREKVQVQFFVSLHLHGGYLYIDEAQDLILGLEGNAEGRPDAQEPDGLAGLESRVHLGVLAQDRHALLKDLVGDGAADLDGAFGIPELAHALGLCSSPVTESAREDHRPLGLHMLKMTSMIFVSTCSTVAAERGVRLTSERTARMRLARARRSMPF